MKSKIIIIASLLLTLIAESAGAAPRMNVTVDGNAVIFDQDPIVQSGVTLVQFKPVFNDLGIGIGWNQKKQQVTGTKDGTSIILNVGSKTAYVNGTPVELQVAPKIIKGSVFVPLRFVSEATGAYVNLSGNVIQIMSKDSFSQSSITPSRPITPTNPSIQPKTSTINELDKYLNDNFSVYYFHGLELDLSFTSNIGKDGQYSLLIDMNDSDDVLELLDMLSDDYSLISELTGKFAPVVHSKYGENNINLHVRSVMYSSVYPSKLPSGAFVIPSDYEGYKVISFMFAARYDYKTKEYYSFIVNANDGKLTMLDGGRL
ncbi:copper amine oxidase N-terminal domain-containing protein [Paenibacillus sp. JTLBN-2024]|uniref:Copper amine oxidase-like N-terminal domain-containing protein n=1 Tax=Paenibacillus cookii TaxID=157839 RepID=A0ABQ4M4H3_9BACL|nr:copper amine oxidase N-terminal domain-containing protein [Paenibacillus cookii]GIO70430.1 hypothetical protein J21TS3_52510 [Paenibacillus cookii]HWO53139.1 copper amine oxidase N-terminal domain-containing protein [Paenibacillus cookii]